MIVYEDECVGCATENFPCIGNACHNINVPHYYCDGDCKQEYDASELYDYDGDMLCIDCLVKKFKTVKESHG